MGAQAPRCPRCGSMRLMQHGLRTYKCVSCDKTIYRKQGEPATPPAAPKEGE